MKRYATFAAALIVWAWTVQPVSAQSALKRLEELIRGNRPAAAEPRPAEGQDAGQAVRRPPQKEAAEKGYLGVIADDRQDRGRGVRVLEVRPASPAELAGLKPKDLITAAGGFRVRQMDDLADVLAQAAPGDVLEFEILRDQKSRKIPVTLGRVAATKPGGAEELRTPPPEPGDDMPRVQDLDDKPPALLPELPRPADRPPPIEARPNVAPKDTQALLESLQHRIEQLEHRVEELERQLRERE